jgi:hypothetical protein
MNKKLVQYPSGSHHKNDESIQRMCKVLSINFESTEDVNRLKQDDYDYLWLPIKFVSPDEIPKKVFILYNPNFFVFPDNSWIDGKQNKDWCKRSICTTLSEWVTNVYAEFVKESVIPIKAIPFGVNETILCDRIIPAVYDCIIYFKNRHPSLLENVISTVSNKGLNYRVFSYGSYSNDDFLYSLRQSKFCIWIGSHESQGFAFQECMMTNTPMLVLDATSMFDEYNGHNMVYSNFLGQKQLKATSATCWTDECGEKCTLENFSEKLELIQSRLHLYTPRKVIIEQRSDKVCMERLIDCFHNLKNLE